MLTVKAEPAILEKLKGLLADEPAGTCVRLREYVVGAACHAKRLLGPSTDEKDELEDVSAEVGGVTFIASESFLDTYGESFELFLDEGRLGVRPLK